MTKDILEETKKEQDLLDIGLKMSRQHKAGRVNEEQIEQLENEIKELEEEKELTNDDYRLALIEEEMYNTQQSIKELKKYV